MYVFSHACIYPPMHHAYIIGGSRGHLYYALALCAHLNRMLRTTSIGNLPLNSLSLSLSHTHIHTRDSGWLWIWSVKRFFICCCFALSAATSLCAGNGENRVRACACVCVCAHAPLIEQDFDHETRRCHAKAETSQTEVVSSLTRMRKS
jgi:hypothetical protein